MFHNILERDTKNILKEKVVFRVIETIFELLKILFEIYQSSQEKEHENPRN